MRVLMVPVSDRPESRTALTIAMGMAGQLNGNILGVHLLPDKDLSKAFKTRGLPLFGSVDKAWLEKVDRQNPDSSLARSSKMFADLMGKSAFKLVPRWSAFASSEAVWLEHVSMPNQFMATHGPLADLILLTRAGKSSYIAQGFLHAALLNSGRPILVLPPQQKRVPGKRIAIAWNQSAEAARVVTSCMPLLQFAETVSVISCGTESRMGPKAAQLQSYLKCYGVRARVFTSRGKDEEQELLQAFQTSQSDLLLMGARSHVHFRELAFGSMTGYMMQDAKIPVVMQHA